MRKYIYILFLVLLAAACRGRGPKPAPEPAKPAAFPMMEVPGVITDPAEATAYLTEHFWDRVETVSGIDSLSLEQAVGTWTSLLITCPREVGEKAVPALVSRLEKLPAADAAPLLDRVERYLYDPNSPVRDEDLYGVLSLALSTSKATPDSLRTHYAYLAEKCALNAVGTKAKDFLFTDGGRIRSLYSVEAEKLLLVFGNPECTACRELHEALAQMDGIRDIVTILEINPDEDSVAKMETDKFYHIRAIPSMYLLDADKTVLLKDVPVERILRALQQINQNQ